MRLSMNARGELAHQLAICYRKGTRKEKSQMLNEFVYATGYRKSEEHSRIPSCHDSKRIQKHPMKKNPAY